METIPFQEQLEENYSDKEIAELRQEAAFNFVDAQLKELRRECGLTQEELAERMGITQPQLSKFENSDDFYLSTLRRYVEALGLEMSITVSLNDEQRRVIL